MQHEMWFMQRGCGWLRPCMCSRDSRSVRYVVMMCGCMYIKMYMCLYCCQVHSRQPSQQVVDAALEHYTSLETLEVGHVLALFLCGQLIVSPRPSLLQRASEILWVGPPAGSVPHECRGTTMAVVDVQRQTRLVAGLQIAETLFVLMVFGVAALVFHRVWWLCWIFNIVYCSAFVCICRACVYCVFVCVMLCVIICAIHCAHCHQVLCVYAFWSSPQSTPP